MIDIPERTFDLGRDAGATATWLPDVLRKLGFELESGRAFVEALIVERIERPSAN